MFRHCYFQVLPVHHIRATSSLGRRGSLKIDPERSGRSGKKREEAGRFRKYRFRHRRMDGCGVGRNFGNISEIGVREQQKP
jgi:hypothetical protein